MMTPSAQLEALLFAHGAPLEGQKIRQLCHWNEAELERAVADLKISLEKRGLILQIWRDRYELVTIPEAAPIIKQFREEEARGELSKTALETLAILLYKGAMTRPELEEIRGIHSHQILRSLSLRGLIAEQSATRVGQAVYEVTPLCLQWLGLANREDLPDFSTFLESIPAHQVPMKASEILDPVGEGSISSENNGAL